MIRTLLAKELREQSRTHRLLILLATLALLGLLSPLSAKYLPFLLKSLPGVPAGMEALLPSPTIADAYLQYIKNLSQLGMLLVIVVNMGIIAAEVERGTAAMLVIKPIRRGAFVSTKWLAASLCLAAGLALATLGFAFYTLVLFEPFTASGLLAIAGLMGVYLLFYLTLALLASTLARTQAAAAAAAFGLLMLTWIIDVLPYVGNYLPGELVSWSATIAVGNPLPNWPALVVSILLIGVLLAIAISRFSREEL